MIPIRDNIPSRTVPIVNYAVIIACTIVFVLQLGEGRRGGRLIERFGMIPARVMHPNRSIEVRQPIRVRTPVGDRLQVATRIMEPSVVATILTMVTCIFLHGGWMHFIGNMWFLYIFGDNVEDRFGHFGYLAFYLFAGVVASGAHLVTNIGSTIPTIGASGAIAGVMGAYLILYPRAKVLTVLPIFFFFQMIILPAPLYLGVWFLLQSFQGVSSFGSVESAGVAWWAHIGGFVAGLVLAFLLGNRHHLNPPVRRGLPNTRHSRSYRLRRGQYPWE